MMGRVVRPSVWRIVRVAISPEQETALDGPETFNLIATNTGGTAATGVGTIKDDGTGEASVHAADAYPYAGDALCLRRTDGGGDGGGVSADGLHTDGDGGARRPRTCFKCGSTSHLIAACPNPQG